MALHGRMRYLDGSRRQKAAEGGSNKKKRPLRAEGRKDARSDEVMRIADGAEIWI